MRKSVDEGDDAEDRNDLDRLFGSYAGLDCLVIPSLAKTPGITRDAMNNVDDRVGKFGRTVVGLIRNPLGRERRFSLGTQRTVHGRALFPGDGDSLTTAPPSAHLSKLALGLSQGGFGVVG